MQLQVRWQQVRQSGNPQEIISFLRGVKPFLELGEDQWINKEKVDSFMAKLGVNFIVVGHEFHAVRYNKRVLNVGGGIWGIDMADVDHQKGYPGHLVMSPKEGIYFKPLLGDVEPEFSKSGLIAHLRQRISVLQDLVIQQNISIEINQIINCLLNFHLDYQLKSEAFAFMTSF